MPSAPISNAGATQSINAGAVATLDGGASSATDQKPLTYSWTLTSKPAGSTATLSSANAVKPTFTADIAGTYGATLTVNDGRADSTASTVNVNAAVSVAAFVQHWQPNICDATIQLHLIDQHLVYARSFAQGCSDNSISILFESTPDHPLCELNGFDSSINCTDENYRAMHKLIQTNSYSADLGLGPTHQVQKIYLGTP